MLVGGMQESFARVQPLRECHASYLRHVGPLGVGMQLKLLNKL
jgi:3-hydroxyisobutyrate dehydrogenase-like beta-hydroxyacid dehydrogenase